MHKIISSIVVLGLMAVISFNFLGVGVHNPGSHNCPTSFLLEEDCPMFDENIALAVHHVSEMQNLTRSILGFNVLLSMLSMFFISVLLTVSVDLSGMSSLDSPFYQKYHEKIEAMFTARKNFLRWLVFQYSQGDDTLVGYGLA